MYTSDNDDEHKIIKSLHDDDTIYLIKPDKGNGVVIINCADHKARMLDILSDKMKFDVFDNTILKKTLTKETKITNLLKELKQEEMISEQQFDELKPIGSRPGILYRLPKAHKPNFTLRLIIPSIGTHCYKVTKFFIPLLHLFSTNPFSTNPLTITDTFSFIIFNFVVTPRNFIIAKLSIRKPGSSSVLIKSDLF